MFRWIDGYKTYLAAFGMVATGLGQIASSYLADDWASIGEGWNLVLAGLAVLGVGHKLAKKK